MGKKTGEQVERLSGVDTAWYRMDSEVNEAVIGGILVLEGSIDFEDLRNLIETRLLENFPRFKQKIVESTGKIARPYWEEDPKFELDAHLHHLALPDPGDQTTLQETASELLTQSLDRTRPLWQVYLLDNYEEGSVLFVKLHHCLGDGFALARILLSLADEGYEIDAVPAGNPGSNGSGNAHRSLGERLRSELEKQLSQSGGIQSVLGEIGDVASELGHILLMSFDPKTQLKNALKGNLRVAWSESLLLDELKTIAHSYDATVNDVLMTGVSGALRSFLKERGDPVDSKNVRAIVPVNLRPAQSIEEMEAVLGNEFGLVFLELPITETKTRDRFRIIKRNIDELKNSPEALVCFGILASEGTATAPVEHLVNDIFARKASLVVSNVPGPKEPLKIAGQTLKDLMFWVPHPTDFGLGISLISYDGRVSIGVRADTAVCETPQQLVDDIVAEFEALKQESRAISDT